MTTKIRWQTFPLDAEIVAAHLAEKLEEKGSVMMDTGSRFAGGRKHLRLHRDGSGFFVKVGRRGGCKAPLGRCKVTYLDGEATLFAFTLASVDAFEAEQARRWEERSRKLIEEAR